MVRVSELIGTRLSATTLLPVELLCAGPAGTEAWLAPEASELPLTFSPIANVVASSTMPAVRGSVTVGISVRDDGLGISEEIRKHIFDPFYTDRKGGGGTGLGLSIVHGIVESHGGRITVESEPGRGTTFRVELPAEPGS